MRRDIIKFVRKACEKYGMEAYFIPESGVYTLTKRGRAVQNFVAHQFDNYPRARRMWEYNALIRAGLAHNLGEKNVYNQIFLPRRYGHKIA